MTEKIKNAFSYPVAIPISVGILSFFISLMAFIFNYFPPGNTSLLAHPEQSEAVYRIGKAEDRLDKIETNYIEVRAKLDTIIEILQGNGKK